MLGSPNPEAPVSLSAQRRPRWRVRRGLTGEAAPRGLEVAGKVVLEVTGQSATSGKAGGLTCAGPSKGPDRARGPTIPNVCSPFLQIVRLRP
jgi:hypothetical protein